MAVQFTRAGGHHAHRRFVAMVLAGMLSLGATPAAAGTEADVAVREERGVYFVTASFEIAQPPSAAIAVLTDFERIPRFMPEVKTSTVLSRFDGGAIVEQEAVARVLMFSKRVHLVLEVHAAEDTIRFKDGCGRSFARYQGKWSLIRQGAVTSIRYELEAQPSFDVPSFLLTRLMKRDAKQMIDRLRAEIAARRGSV